MLAPLLSTCSLVLPKPHLSLNILHLNSTKLFSCTPYVIQKYSTHMVASLKKSASIGTSYICLLHLTTEALKISLEMSRKPIPTRRDYSWCHCSSLWLLQLPPNPAHPCSCSLPTSSYFSKSKRMISGRAREITVQIQSLQQSCFEKTPLSYRHSGSFIV